MDNCGGQSYDGAGNMAGRYAGVLTLIQHQFPKFILLLDKFLLVETSHTNCWIHPCPVCSSLSLSRKLAKMDDCIDLVIRMFVCRL